jgi:hypothetical protein
MTVKIYIWDPLPMATFKSSTFNAITLRDVGHVSMEINDTYISHRPKLTDNYEQNNEIIKREYLLQQPIIYQSTNNNSSITIDNNGNVTMIGANNSSITIDNNGNVTMIGANNNKMIINNNGNMSVQRANKSISNKIDLNENINNEYIDNVSNKDLTKLFLLSQSVASEDSTNYNYKLECFRKKREANVIFKINYLNEVKMLEYYKSLKKPALLYHPLRNNCSRFIADVVKSSLNCSTELCSFCSNTYVPYLKLQNQNIYLWTPIVIKNYINQLQKEKGANSVIQNIINFVSKEKEINLLNNCLKET